MPQHTLAVPQAHTAALDWLAAYDRLRSQGMAQPETTQLRADSHPPWWWGTTPEERASGQAQALPFGDLGDPVSQLAFLVSPFLQAGARAALAPPAPGASLRGFGAYYGPGTPGSRLSLVRNQRGNLGPPPTNEAGVPLPESLVRGEGGELQRLYHGTQRAYPDFDLSYAGKGAGGDLYGPGIYLTENPSIATAYAEQGFSAATITAMTQEAERRVAQLQGQLTLLTKTPESPAAQALVRSTNEVNTLFGDRSAQSVAALRQQTEQRLKVAQQELNSIRGIAPNVRPTYANLRKPLDLEAPADQGLVQKIQDLGLDYYLKPDQRTPDIATNKDLYATLLRNFGTKNDVNDWLQANGFDGITHIGGAVSGGQPHRVYIAFSPEQVYPSFNVDALRQSQGGAR